MKNKLKVLLLFDSPYATDRGYDFKKEFKEIDWATEDDIHKSLLSLGYKVSLLGLYDKITPLLKEIEENRPDIVFNLTEVFRQRSHLDKNIAWLLELLKVKYTGANPASLLICNDKGLTKKILSFHRIRVPQFQVLYKGHKIRPLKKLKFPLIVKPLAEEASRGISLASVIDNQQSLLERISFIQEKMNSDVIIEEYIDGREIYVSILGNKRIQVLPFREMKFGEFSEDEPRIATYKAKWNYEYREKWGIKNVFAGRLPDGADKKIIDTCKRAYRALNMQCYARFDIRITPDSKVYIIEANANPCLAKYDELGQSAEKAGISFEKLVQKIITLALTRKG